MKKIMSFTLAFLMVFSNTLGVSAETINGEDEANTPYEQDRLLYGDQIEFRIVIYDQTTGYINPNYIDTLMGVTLNAVVPDDDVIGGAFHFKYFSKVEWISRSGKISLSLTPRDGTVINKQKNWDSIYVTYKNDNYWKNSGNSTVDASMYNQFVCHYDFAPYAGNSSYADFLETWDLEPGTPDKGYWGFVNNKCN